MARQKGIVWNRRGQHCPERNTMKVEVRRIDLSRKFVYVTSTCKIVRLPEKCNLQLWKWRPNTGIMNDFRFFRMVASGAVENVKMCWKLHWCQWTFSITTTTILNCKKTTHSFANQRAQCVDLEQTGAVPRFKPHKTHLEYAKAQRKRSTSSRKALKMP